MAKKKEEKPKTVMERTYNVPLRKEFQKAPKWRRTKKAVKALREFIIKHMKSEEVKIGKYLNLRLWKHGIKNPPHHIKVKAIKDDKGVVLVELAELPKEALLEKQKEEEKAKEKEAKEKEKKAEEPKKEAKPEGKAEETKETKPEEEKKEEKPAEEKTEEAKKIEKEELKELKKEMPKLKAEKPPAIPKQVQQQPTGPQQK